MPRGEMMLPLPTDSLYEALGQPEVVFEGGEVTYDDGQAAMLLELFKHPNQPVSSDVLLQYSDGPSPAEHVAQVRDFVWSAACDSYLADRYSWQFTDHRQVELTLAMQPQDKHQVSIPDSLVDQKSNFAHSQVPITSDESINPVEVDRLFQVSYDGSYTLPEWLKEPEQSCAVEDVSPSADALSPKTARPRTVYETMLENERNSPRTVDQRQNIMQERRELPQPRKQAARTQQAKRNVRAPLSVVTEPTVYQFKPLPRPEPVQTYKNESGPAGEEVTTVNLPSGIRITRQGTSRKLYFNNRFIKSHSEPIEVLEIIAQRRGRMDIGELVDIVQARHDSDPLASPLITVDNLWWHLYAIGRVFTDNNLVGFTDMSARVDDKNGVIERNNRQGWVQLDKYIWQESA